MIEIGKFIFLKRKQLNMTQSELAKKAELAQSTLSNIEKGESTPFFSVLEKIINNGFEISLQDFFSSIDDYDKLPLNLPNISQNSVIYETEKLKINEFNTLGEKLKFLRESYNTTQLEVASILGITKSAYSSYERNITKPSQKSLYVLSKLFDIPLKSLGFELKDLSTDLIVDLSDLKKSDSKFVLSLIERLRNLTY